MSKQPAAKATTQQSQQQQQILSSQASHQLNVPITPKDMARQKTAPPPKPEDIFDGVFGSEKFRGFILKPSSVKRVWNSSNMKEELILIFQEFFKPKSSLEPEKVEYNEINIFSEYQLYNLVFAKNQLMYDDYKSSLLLNLCWRLLEFNVDAPSFSDLDSVQADRPLSHNQRISTSSTVGRSNMGGFNKSPIQQQQQIPKSPDSEQEFASLLKHKFSLFKTLLFEQLQESDASLQFSQEEVKRIADYMKDSYFKHLKLYDYVLNNKQLSEVKRLTVNYNEPIIAQNLNDALLLGVDDGTKHIDEAELARLELIERQEELEAEQKRQEELEARKRMEEDEDEDLKVMDEKLRKAKLDKETKVIIHTKITNLDTDLVKTMDEKMRLLDEKVAQGAAAAQKKK